MAGDWNSDTKAFEAAVERAARTSPLAAEMIGVAAYLAPDDIPMELFGATGKGTPAAATALQALVDGGLAKAGNASFAISAAHQKLARAAAASRGDDGRLIGLALERLTAAFPKPPASTDVNSWSRCERLLRHARALLEFAPDEGEKAPLTSDLLHRIAHYLFARTRLDDAEAVVRRAGAIDEIVLGPGDEVVAQDRANLAILLHELGRPEEALPHIRRAMAIGEEQYGPQHPIVAERYNILATLLDELERPAQADPFIRHALLVAERILGRDHPDTRLYRANYERIIAEVDNIARRDDAIEAGQIPAPPERLARQDLPPPGSRNRGVMRRLLRARS